RGLRFAVAEVGGLRFAVAEVGGLRFAVAEVGGLRFAIAVGERSPRGSAPLRGRVLGSCASREDGGTAVDGTC
ncbi:hypothetical protein, partial [Rathayibacter sp. AY1F9]|uniref:hypothetical protein n=1 Tax=Rathayibacter sp. AY1F9 TaxID=2080563 RepID=UPI000D4E33D4